MKKNQCRDSRGRWTCEEIPYRSWKKAPPVSARPTTPLHELLSKMTGVQVEFLSEKITMPKSITVGNTTITLPENIEEIFVGVASMSGTNVGSVGFRLNDPNVKFEW